jgi:hypothetical protein
LKARWSKEWATLLNHNLKNVDSGIKHSSPEKWAIEVIMLTWDLIYNIWLLRNKCEHDHNGDPEKRKKEKLIEVIQGESAIMNYEIYSLEELETDELLGSPIENLEMLVANLKNEKERQRKEKNNVNMSQS